MKPAFRLRMLKYALSVFTLVSSCYSGPLIACWSGSEDECEAPFAGPPPDADAAAGSGSGGSAGNAGSSAMSAPDAAAFQRPDDSGNGGSAASAGSGGELSAILIAPDATGRVDASTNPLGLEGQWQVFGDSYGSNGRPPGVCQAAGHAESECSLASLPDNATPGFPNIGGAMCTTARTAVVLLVDGGFDYSNMWGIGIRLNLADGGGQPGEPFDASARGIIGISFDIDSVPEPGLRVLFPTPSDSLQVGPSYWGAGESYPSSPAQAGTNTVLFQEVRSPAGIPQALDTTQLLEIGFLAPSDPVSSHSFSYCISNLQLIVE